MGLDFPWALLFGLALIPLLWTLRRGERRTDEVVRTFRSPTARRRLTLVQAVLLGVFLAALVLVGARPYLVPRQTGDYLFLTDVSRSMMARYSCSEPTFLERAKTVMNRVMAGVPEGRFGLIAFARLTFPITQMSYDHGYLRDVIDHALSVGMIFEATATGVGNALEVVARKKTELPEIYGGVEYVILLSDGHVVDEDSPQQLEQSLAALQQAGIRVISVGIGNPGETPIPRMRGDECLDDYLQVEQDTLRIPLREDLLEVIASETQGRYFGEGGVPELIRFLREETLVAAPEEVRFAAEQQQDISWVFLLAATLALFGFLAL